MTKLRSERGVTSFVGILAALVIVAMLVVASKSNFQFGGAVSKSGTDSSAMLYANKAYDALAICISRSAPSQCSGQELVSNFDPTLTPVANKLTVNASPPSVSVAASDSGNVYTVAQAGSGRTYSCTTAGRPDCPPGGVWAPR
jgi:hypothetical protein